MKEEHNHPQQQHNGANYFLTSRILDRISSQSASSLLKTINNTKKESRLSKVVSQNNKNTTSPLSTKSPSNKLTLNLSQEASVSFFSHRVQQPSPANSKRINLTNSPLCSLDSPSCSSSLSFQQYRDLLSSSSPAAIHLPARRLSNQARIIEDVFSLPIQTGFTSFYKIKAENQDFLINLHDQRQSVSELVDLQQLQMARQIAKKQADLEYRRVSNFNINNYRHSVLAKPKNVLPRFNYENRDQMELELNHNRSMLESFSKHTKIEAMQSFTLAQSAFQDTQDKVLKMPPIRKYPIQRRREQVDAPNAMPIGEEQFDKNHPDNQRIDQLQASSIIMHKVLFYNIPQDDWRPCAREGSTFVLDKNKAYLFGGMGHEIFDSLDVVELENSLHWKTIEHISAKISVPAARYGHSMNLYKGNLVVFGGEKQFNPNFKEKSCLFDVHLFNIEQQKWQLLNNTSGEFPQARRGHAATIIGRQLIVHGGSNSRDTVLADLWAFDLGTSSWQELSTHDQESSTILPPKHFALAHGCCNVFYPSKISKLQLFKTQEIKIPKWVPQIIFEGVYYFGGKDETGKATNKLRVLKIDCKPVQWIVPSTHGKSPAARYQHIVEYVCVLNLIVVYGGKNDGFDDPGEVYLNDLHILQIDSLCWVQIELHSQIPPVPRANHSAVVYDTKLLIFGGLNQDGYLSSQVQLIELDSDLSRQMIRKEQAQRVDVDADYPINDKSPSSGLRKLHKIGKKTGLSSPEAKKSIELDWSQVMNNNTSNNHRLLHDYKEIPFSNKAKVVEKQPTEEQRVIEKLVFKNFTSFLPQPKGQSLSHLKLRSLSQAKDQLQQQHQDTQHQKGSDVSPLNNGSSSTPTQRLQKTVSKIAALQGVLKKIKHA